MGTFFLREDQRRAALKAHAETKARIRAIANNAPLVLCQFMLEPTGRPVFTYLSDASGRILGISPTGVIADPARFLGGLTDDSGDAFATAITPSTMPGH